MKPAASSGFSPLARRGPFLALGLVLVAALSAHGLVIGPWQAARAAYQDQILTERAVVARYRQALSRMRAEIEATRRLQADPALGRSFLDLADDGLAAAALQARLKETAAEQGVDLNSLQVLPPVATPGAREVRVSVSLETTIEPLVRLIHGLESGLPLIRINAIEVQTPVDQDGTLLVGLEAMGLVPEAPL